MSNDDASNSDGGQVADIIAAQPRTSTWQPTAPVELYVRHRHAPGVAADLGPVELRQLGCMWGDDNIDTILREGIDDFPVDLEIATVVDERGAPRYRLYGWDFGVVYLMAFDGLECVAFASQHDLEPWHTDQREVFWAMDRAMRRNDHGFKQPMKFCWWDDECWAAIAGEPRGTLRSEPHILRQFADSSGLKRSQE